MTPGRSNLKWITEGGFDPARLTYGIRTAIACCLAMLVAWALGLEHPQWSGMSVWAASQPLRGQLLEKSLFRVSGTVIGCGVGILLVQAMIVHPVWLVLGLAVWIAACTWLGNLQRGYTAYGTVLAGYSASMVALLDTAHPDRVLALGFDRLATVLTGVAVATLIGYVFGKATADTGLQQRVRSLLADVLRHMAHPQRETSPGHGLLARLAAIEEELDGHGAGSFRSRREVRATRSLLIALVPLVLRSEGRALSQPVLADPLVKAAELMVGDNVAATRRQLDLILATAVPSQLKRDLQGMQSAFAIWSEPAGTAAEETGRKDRKANTDANAPPVILHRDFMGAREAATRAGGAMLLFGFIWLATGWDVGAYMLLGLSVMISLFSTFENPPYIMRFIILGQMMGVVAALAARWLVWPLAGSELEQILMLFPFVLIGPVLLAHPRTMIASTDYNMVLLLLSQPVMPLTGDFAHSLFMALAVLSAPLVALAGYLLIYPISLKRRQQHLMAMMMNDLASIARNDLALKHRLVWQARLYHRSLRLVRLSEKLARAEDRALSSSVAVLALGRIAMRCHELLQERGVSTAKRRAARQVLARIQRIDQDRRHLVTALEQLDSRLRPHETTVIPIALRALQHSL